MTQENTPRPPNRLARETSPYLQQHAHNPVDWYPWGEEALRKAKELDRPIFLSIGYSACHWCHVMERESFEDEEIARFLNEHFISIKVDREERPDLDAIYMTSVQQLTGSGGWPMSVFLTPELKPFYGGTYFPPRSRYGRPGFLDLLRGIAGAFRDRRAEVEENAALLTRYLAEGERIEGGKTLPGEEALAAAVAGARRTFDPTYGGFGPAPKFPRSIELSVLLRHWSRARDPEVLAMCEKTLEAMALGGMYDQIGGGFHRYSTDERWLVPHFEKMLYDNALLARAYVEAFQATGKNFHARIAAETLDYVLREMTDPEGAFYSSTDADSEGEEGKYFVWTPEQVEAALGKEEARLACEYWDITVGGNFEDSTSIPHVTSSAETVARALRLEPRDVSRRLARARQVLLAEREKREKPFRDQKVLTAWNGLMVSAFARAGAVLDEPRYLEAARKAAAFILTALSPGGRLHRVYKDGHVAVPGYLDDHAYLAEALLDLYEATFDPGHLRSARALMEDLIAGFWDPDQGGFFFAAAGAGDLIVRKKDFLDNATPAGNGVAALNLLRLERLTGENRYRTLAEDLFKALQPVLERIAVAFGSTLIALDFYLHPPVEIALLGDLDAPGMKALLAAVHRRFLPARVLAAAPAEGGTLASEVPLLAGKEASDGKPTAYVCRDLACRPPVTTPEALGALLDGEV